MSTEPNYFALAAVFLGPAVYFIVAGLIFKPRRVRWKTVLLGLVPGIGLVACAADARDLLYLIWQRRR